MCCCPMETPPGNGGDTSLRGNSAPGPGARGPELDRSDRAASGLLLILVLVVVVVVVVSAAGGAAARACIQSSCKLC